MSALPPKADIGNSVWKCPLCPKSRHFGAESQCPLSGVKRTSDGMSGTSPYDPKLTAPRSTYRTPLSISFTLLEQHGILLYRSACARKRRLLFRADMFQSLDARRSIPRSAACPRNPLACPRPSLESLSTSSNELYRCDLKGIESHTYYHQLAVGLEAVE